MANSAANPAQAIQIVNVVYHIRVDDPTKAKLIVPPSGPLGLGNKAKASLYATSFLAPGTEVQEMFLFPLDNKLEPGNTDRVILKANALAAGTPRLTFNVLGDVDLGFLIPVRQSSATSSQSVAIVS